MEFCFKTLIIAKKLIYVGLCKNSPPFKMVTNIFLFTFLKLLNFCKVALEPKECIQKLFNNKLL